MNKMKQEISELMNYALNTEVWCYSCHDAALYRTTSTGIYHTETGITWLYDELESIHPYDFFITAEDFKKIQ